MLVLTFSLETLTLMWMKSSCGKPLLAARDPKCFATDAEAGVLAMEALHNICGKFINLALNLILYVGFTFAFMWMKPGNKSRKKCKQMSEKMGATQGFRVSFGRSS